MERPDPRLLTCYLLGALVVPPAFPFLAVYLYCRYHTLRYRFDESGISMRWGILFRRETVVNYARIQDIQIRANILERWLGLARIELQTAAGSSSAEMTLEGFTNVEAVRDFLYSRMRGARGDLSESRVAVLGGEGATVPAESLAQILQEVASELRAIREKLESTR
ncbi:MAG: PH domain-containing protein [Verrucomicrobiales bacterium]|nr:PH domain-containing protein [Verrucomicrobiales bacterium]